MKTIVVLFLILSLNAFPQRRPSPRWIVVYVSESDEMAREQVTGRDVHEVLESFEKLHSGGAARIRGVCHADYLNCE